MKHVKIMKLVIMMSFSENLKKYRIEAGFDQAKKFANYLGIPYNCYIGYESKGVQPKFELLCKISQELQVPIDILLDNDIRPCESCEYRQLVDGIKKLLTNQKRLI